MLRPVADKYKTLKTLGDDGSQNNMVVVIKPLFFVVTVIIVKQLQSVVASLGNISISQMVQALRILLLT